MRAVLIACLAFLCVPKDALALHPPSQKEWDEIKKFEDKGNFYAVKLEEYRETRKRQGLVDDDKKAQDIEFDRNVQYVQAIRLAMRAYGLPPVGIGTSKVPGKNKGEAVHWLLTAGDRDARQKKKYTGAPDEEYAVSDPDKQATTYSDGVTVVFPEAFQSPGRLMMTLVHEQEHYIRNTTNANRITADENELAAQNAELAPEVLAAFYKFELTREDVKHVEFLQDRANKLAEKVSLNTASESSLKKFRRHIGMPMDADLQHKTLSPEELDAIKRSMKAIDARIEAEEQARAAAREEVRYYRDWGWRCDSDDVPGSCVAPPPAPPPSVAYADRNLAQATLPPKEDRPPVAPSPASTEGPCPRPRPQPGSTPAGPMARGAGVDDFTELEGLANKACADPQSVTQGHLCFQYRWIPTGRDFFDRVPADLSECALSVLRELLKFNRSESGGGSINAEWLEGAASFARQQEKYWRDRREREAQERAAHDSANKRPQPSQPRQPSRPSPPDDCIYRGERCIGGSGRGSSR